MFVAKYLLDENNPYIIRGQLRTNNIKLAEVFKDKSEIRRVITQYGYDLTNIEFVEV